MELVSHYPALNRPTAPLVSVCIANYNGEDLLPDCMKSLRRQDADFLFEILVHDDASKDGSIELLRSDYPDVEILASNENAGFCIANNRMAAHARGRYILLLNNDAALFPDALSTLLAEAEDHPEGAILSLPQFDWDSDTLVDRGSLLDPFYNPTPNIDPQRNDVAMVIGACLWIDRQNWQHLGGFPEWFESIAEDLWLCSKARLRGLPVRALRTSGFRHRQGHSFGGNSPNEGRISSPLHRRQLSERNKTYVLFCMTPAPILPFLLLAHSVALLIEGLGLSILKSDFSILKRIYTNALHEAIINRKTLIRSRKHIQSARHLNVTDYLKVFLLLPRKLRLFIKYGIPDISNRD